MREAESKGATLLPQPPTHHEPSTPFIATPVSVHPLPTPTQTPFWKRLLASAYFVLVTVSSASIGLVCVLIIIAISRALGLIGYYFNESEDSKFERLCLEEQARGLTIDTAVRAIMLLCSIIWKVEVLGENGSPVAKAAPREWAKWQEQHSFRRGGIKFCPLERVPGGLKMPGGCLVMCNHMSNIDGFTMKSTLFPSVSRAIIKGDVIRMPIVGWLILLSGEPLIHFTREKGGWATLNTPEMLQRCKDILKRNFPLIVYPEGARRMYGRMAPFRHGMIKFAIENESPIVTSVIHGSQRCWPVHDPLVDTGHMYVKFSDEVLIPDKTNTVEEVCNIIRSKMLGLLEGVPGYDREAELPITSVAEYKAIENAAKAADSARKEVRKRQ